MSPEFDNGRASSDKAAKVPDQQDRAPNRADRLKSYEFSGLGSAGSASKFGDTQDPSARFSEEVQQEGRKQRQQPVELAQRAGLPSAPLTWREEPWIKQNPALASQLQNAETQALRLGREPWLAAKNLTHNRNDHSDAANLLYALELREAQLAAKTGLRKGTGTALLTPDLKDALISWKMVGNADGSLFALEQAHRNGAKLTGADSERLLKAESVALKKMIETNAKEMTPEMWERYLAIKDITEFNNTRPENAKLKGETLAQAIDQKTAQYHANPDLVAEEVKKIPGVRQAETTQGTPGVTPDAVAPVTPGAPRGELPTSGSPSASGAGPSMALPQELGGQPVDAPKPAASNLPVETARGVSPSVGPRVEPGRPKAEPQPETKDKNDGWGAWDVVKAVGAIGLGWSGYRLGRSFRRSNELTNLDVSGMSSEERREVRQDLRVRQLNGDIVTRGFQRAYNNGWWVSHEGQTERYVTAVEAKLKEGKVNLDKGNSETWIKARATAVEVYEKEAPKMSGRARLMAREFIADLSAQSNHNGCQTLREYLNNAHDELGNGVEETEVDKTGLDTKKEGEFQKKYRETMYYDPQVADWDTAVRNLKRQLTRLPESADPEERSALKAVVEEFKQKRDDQLDFTTEKIKYIDSTKPEGGKIADERKSIAHNLIKKSGRLVTNTFVLDELKNVQEEANRGTDRIKMEAAHELVEEWTARVYGDQHRGIEREPQGYAYLHLARHEHRDAMPESDAIDAAREEVGKTLIKKCTGKTTNGDVINKLFPQMAKGILENRTTTDTERIAQLEVLAELRKEWPCDPGDLRQPALRKAWEVAGKLNPPNQGEISAAQESLAKKILDSASPKTNKAALELVESAHREALNGNDEAAIKAAEQLTQHFSTAPAGESPYFKLVCAAERKEPLEKDANLAGVAEEVRSQLSHKDCTNKNIAQKFEELLDNAISDKSRDIKRLHALELHIERWNKKAAEPGENGADVLCKQAGFTGSDQDKAFEKLSKEVLNKLNSEAPKRNREPNNGDIADAWKFVRDEYRKNESPDPACESVFKKNYDENWAKTDRGQSNWEEFCRSIGQTVDKPDGINDGALLTEAKQKLCDRLRQLVSPGMENRVIRDKWQLIANQVVTEPLDLNQRTALKELRAEWTKKAPTGHDAQELCRASGRSQEVDRTPGGNFDLAKRAIYKDVSTHLPTGTTAGVTNKQALDAWRAAQVAENNRVPADLVRLEVFKEEMLKWEPLGTDATTKSRSAELALLQGAGEVREFDTKEVSRQGQLFAEEKLKETTGNTTRKEYYEKIAAEKDALEAKPLTEVDINRLQAVRQAEAHWKELSGQGARPNPADAGKLAYADIYKDAGYEANPEKVQDVRREIAENAARNLPGTTTSEQYSVHCNERQTKELAKPLSETTIANLEAVTGTADDSTEAAVTDPEKLAGPEILKESGQKADATEVSKQTGEINRHLRDTAPARVENSTCLETINKLCEPKIADLGINKMEALAARAADWKTVAAAQPNGDALAKLTADAGDKAVGEKVAEFHESLARDHAKTLKADTTNQQYLDFLKSQHEAESKKAPKDYDPSRLQALSEKITAWETRATANPPASSSELAGLQILKEAGQEPDADKVNEHVKEINKSLRDNAPAGVNNKWCVEAINKGQDFGKRIIEEVGADTLEACRVKAVEWQKRIDDEGPDGEATLKLIQDAAELNPDKVKAESQKVAEELKAEASAGITYDECITLLEEKRRAELSEKSPAELSLNRLEAIDQKIKEWQDKAQGKHGEVATLDIHRDTLAGDDQALAEFDDAVEEMKVTIGKEIREKAKGSVRNQDVVNKLREMRNQLNTQSAGEVDAVRLAAVTDHLANWQDRTSNGAKDQNASSELAEMAGETVPNAEAVKAKVREIIQRELLPACKDDTTNRKFAATVRALKNTELDKTGYDLARVAAYKELDEAWKERKDSRAGGIGGELALAQLQKDLRDAGDTTHTTPPERAEIDAARRHLANEWLRPGGAESWDVPMHSNNEVGRKALSEFLDAQLTKMTDAAQIKATEELIAECDKPNTGTNTTPANILAHAADPLGKEKWEFISNVHNGIAELEWQDEADKNDQQSGNKPSPAAEDSDKARELVKEFVNIEIDKAVTDGKLSKEAAEELRQSFDSKFASPAAATAASTEDRSPSKLVENMGKETPHDRATGPSGFEGDAGAQRRIIDEVIWQAGEEASKGVGGWDIHSTEPDERAAAWQNVEKLIDKTCAEQDVDESAREAIKDTFKPDESKSIAESLRSTRAYGDVALRDKTLSLVTNGGTAVELTRDSNLIGGHEATAEEIMAALVEARQHERDAAPEGERKERLNEISKELAEIAKDSKKSAEVVEAIRVGDRAVEAKYFPRSHAKLAEIFMIGGVVITATLKYMVGDKPKQTISVQKGDTSGGVR